jgi:Family of unknown function (DUF6190)
MNQKFQAEYLMSALDMSHLVIYCLKDQSQMQELVDASLFLGMNSIDEEVRVACKNYFVDRFQQSIGMSDDQAGTCDRIIWKFSRELQDIYYPFMDRLRTDMDIQGLEYDIEDITVAQSDQRLNGLRVSQKLTLGMAIARHKPLYTVDTDISKINLGLSQDHQLAVFDPELGVEKSFPDIILEKCYQESLSLRIT